MKKEDLELEIKVLKERVSILEGKERKSKIRNIIKSVIIVFILIIIILLVYDWYQRIIEIYDFIRI